MNRKLLCDRSKQLAQESRWHEMEAQRLRREQAQILQDIMLFDKQRLEDYSPQQIGAMLKDRKPVLRAVK